MSGTVKILAAIGNLGSARTMNYSPNEGSVTNNVGGFWTTATPPVWNANGATTNNGSPSWTTVSHTYYADNIINRNTGATVLRLPLVSQGATPIDLIRRPLVNSNEDTANPLVFGQRYFGPMAGIRILLSDRAEDITNLPTVTADRANLARRGLELRGRAPRRAAGRVRGRCDPSADCASDRPDRYHDGRRQPSTTRLPMRRFM